MLTQYTPRYQEVLTDFRSLRDDIPTNFKTAFARYELEKKGFGNLLIESQIGEPENEHKNPFNTDERPENPDLTLYDLLREIGRSDEYAKNRAGATFRLLKKAGFDFNCPAWVEEYCEGTRGRKTYVKFTPAGYLATFSYMSPSFCGPENKKKYVKFQSLSAVFTTKLDMIYTDQMQALQLENTRMMLQVTRARRALTSTTNETNQSFWGHLINLCKASGKVAPRFQPEWNHNAQTIQDLRVELTELGRLRKPDNCAWIYRNIATKNAVIARFALLNLE
jgi:hypothetical protein